MSSGPDRVVWPSLASVSQYVYIYVAFPTVNLYRRLNRSVNVEECFACSSDRRHAMSTGGHHRDPYNCTGLKQNLHLLTLLLFLLQVLPSHGSKLVALM